MERLASTPGVTLKGLELSWGKQSSLNHCSGQKSFARHYLNSNWGREICTKHTHFSAHTALRNSQLTFSFIVSELCIVTFFFFLRKAAAEQASTAICRCLHSTWPERICDYCLNTDTSHVSNRTHLKIRIIKLIAGIVSQKKSILKKNLCPPQQKYPQRT